MFYVMYDRLRLYKAPWNYSVTYNKIKITYSHTPLTFQYYRGYFKVSCMSKFMHELFCIVVLVVYVEIYCNCYITLLKVSVSTTAQIKSCSQRKNGEAFTDSFLLIRLTTNRQSSFIKLELFDNTVKKTAFTCYEITHPVLQRITNVQSFESGMQLK